jgi:F-type H+-transporting ATPase subunit a
MALFGVAHVPSTIEEAVAHVQNEVGDSPTWTILTYFGDPLPIIKIFGFQITRFMLLELIAAGLIMAIFIPLARRAARQAVPTGAWWNTFECLLTFIRDEVARPCLSPPADHHASHGEAHDDHHPGPAHGPREDPADRYVPYLWTVFLFVLFCNLLGLIPTCGSPTASLMVTGALAVCSFLMIHGVAIARMGFVPYVKSLWPHMDIPYGIGYVLKPMIFLIEFIGTIIKSGVLAVRLFANMFAGHMVLGMILTFIVLVANIPVLWAGVTVASVLGVVALSLLELFVAFLQAYIFTFLTALFMGMALYPQH